MPTYLWAHLPRGLLAFEFASFEKHPDAQNEHGRDDNVVARVDATESTEFSNDAAAAEKHETDTTAGERASKGWLALGADAAVVKQGNEETGESAEQKGQGSVNRHRRSCDFHSSYL